MKSQILEKNNIYKLFNDITIKNEIVIFGATYTAKFPFYELSQKYYFNNAIYNRSIEGMTLSEAEKILDDSVLAVKPSKIFLALGECDIENPEAQKTYGHILSKIKKNLPETLIYILSVCGESDKIIQFNKLLKELCENNHVEYIDINYNSSYDSIFKRLSVFFRKSSITVCEAFQVS